MKKRFFMVLEDLTPVEMQLVRSLFHEAGYVRLGMEADVGRRLVAVFAEGAALPYALLAHPKLQAFHQGSPADVGYLAHRFGEKTARVVLAYNADFLALMEREIKERTAG